MTTTPPDRLDRIEAIAAQNTIAIAQLSNKVDQLTVAVHETNVLVQKHERSRMAFRRYMREVHEEQAKAQLRHDEIMIFLRGQQLEMRRLIDKFVGDDDPMNDEEGPLENTR